MPRFRFELTAPGFGSSPKTTVSDMPPPPKPPRPPTMASAARSMVGRPSSTSPEQGAIRNIGGSRGLDISSTYRALKALTGL